MNAWKVLVRGLALMFILSPTACRKENSEIFSAVKEGDVEKVNSLLAQNPRLVKAEDKEGRTPLHWAAFEGHVEVVEAILAHGAEINASWEAGTSLHAAARNGHYEVVELLLNKGAEITKDSFGQTPLHWAAINGHKEMVELLLAHGAKVNVKNITGNTPLDMALSRGHHEVADLLRQHGSEE